MHELKVNCKAEIKIESLLSVPNSTVGFSFKILYPFYTSLNNSSLTEDTCCTAQIRCSNVLQSGAFYNMFSKQIFFD